MLLIIEYYCLNFPSLICHHVHLTHRSQWENETSRRTLSYCWQTSFIIWSHLSPTGEHTCFAGTATINRSPHQHSSRRWLEAPTEEIGNKWKKTLVYLLVLPGSRARIVRCGGRYDHQLVKHSSEWVSEWVSALNWIISFLTCRSCGNSDLCHCI